MYPHQDAADIFADLATGGSTAKGALFELEWAAKHKSELEAMGVPMYRKGWRGIGKGPDILKKNGIAVEIKNYDFTRKIYSGHPGRMAAGIRRQLESRLKWIKPPVAGVTIVFDSGTAMPAAFRGEIDKVVNELAQKYPGRPVTCELWP